MDRNLCVAQWCLPPPILLGCPLLILITCFSRGLHLDGNISSSLNDLLARHLRESAQQGHLAYMKRQLEVTRVNEEILACRSHNQDIFLFVEVSSDFMWQNIWDIRSLFCSFIHLHGGSLIWQSILNSFGTAFAIDGEENLLAKTCPRQELRSHAGQSYCY